MAVNDQELATKAMNALKKVLDTEFAYVQQQLQKFTTPVAVLEVHGTGDLIKVEISFRDLSEMPAEYHELGARDSAKLPVLIGHVQDNFVRHIGVAGVLLSHFAKAVN
jgi:hypothetical protein